MTLGYEFRPTLVFNKDILNRISAFFEDPNDSAECKRSRANSSGSENNLLDADESAGVDEWQSMENNENSEQNENSFSTAWLSGCLICSFGSLDYFVIVGNKRYAVLTRRPTEDCTVELLCMKTVEHLIDKEEDFISCCEVFGLGSSRKSETMDCMTIALGLSDGRVEFYTEKGTLLFHENFSYSKPIITISFDQYTGGQQLTVASSEEVFFISSESLLSVLSQSKTAIARGEKTSDELSDMLQLECERIDVEGRSNLHRVIFTGPYKTTALERYISASMDGKDSRLESLISPNYITIFATSDDSLGDFVWYPEGSNVNIWTDAVSKIASSVLPHFGFRKFLGISSGSNKKDVLSVSKGTAPIRSSFEDDRFFNKLSRAPLGRGLIAGADNVARVVLIDVKRRIISRIWKGYRDASVAWLTVSRDNKRVVFLVIYAPRLSLLEVWLPYGDRIAAQRVDPKGYLIEDTGCMVLSSNQKDAKEESKVFFLDSKGVLSEIYIPFHCALKKYQTGQAHDQIVLESLVSGSNTSGYDHILKAFDSLNTDEAKHNALSSILQSTTDINEFEKVIGEIKKKQLSDDFRKRIDHVDGMFGILKDLLQLYRSGNKSETAFDFPLHPESEAIFKKHLELGDEGSLSEKFDIQTFFSLFSWNSTDTELILKKDLTTENILPFAQLLFLPYLKGGKDVSLLFDQFIPKLNFPIKTYAHMLLSFVLHSTFPFEKCFGNFIVLLSEFLKEIPDDISIWEKMGLESSNINRCIMIYVALFIIRNGSKILERRQNVSTGEASLEWDTVDPLIELADSTLSAMHICWILSHLNSECSYRKMLQKGPGFIREQIASWIVEKDVTVDCLDEVLNESEDITELIKLLPLTTSKDLLHADIAWELASFWFKKRGERMESLENSISFISVIENTKLKLGLSKLVWDKFLAEPLKILSREIEQNGRTPTDRESRNVLQIPENCLPALIDITISLLDIMRESARHGTNFDEVPVDHTLQLACAHPPDFCKDKTVTSVDSLVHIAFKQNMINYHLVLHNLQIYHVYQLLFLSNINIKPKRILFCENGVRAFDHPLDSHPLVPEAVDDIYMKNRHDFLTKIAEDGTDVERRLARDLASEWGLNDDSIALMQLLHYLRIGNDEEAKLELGAVRSEHLGLRIARIFAARVIQLAAEENKTLPGSISRFLRELADDEVVNWEGSWKNAVKSLADLVSFMNMEPKDVPNFIKIGTITRQYWGIKCYNA